MEEKIQERIDKLKEEKENTLYWASGLSYSHQFDTKIALLNKAENIQGRIEELELLIKNENL